MHAPTSLLQTARVVFAAPSTNLGDIVVEEDIQANVELKNVSQTAIGIESVNTTCSCARATYERETRTVGPGGMLKVTVRIAPKQGSERWPIQIGLTNGQKYEYVLYGKTYRRVMLSADALSLGPKQACPERRFAA